MAVTISDVKVSGLSTEQDVDINGGIRDIVRVHYMIGDSGPYSISIPKLEMTAQRVLQDVRSDAQRFVDVLNLIF